MPITRYKLSCDTQRDLDIIEFLDSFSAEERRIVIRSAIREYMERELGIVQESVQENVQENAPSFDTSYDRLDSLEKKVNDILREVIEIRRKSSFTIPSNNDTINNDTVELGQDTSETESNIMNLFED